MHPRILIAEDEPAIAIDLEMSLREAGYEPVGPATTRSELDALIAAMDVSGAVLDVGLLGPTPEASLGPLVAGRVPIIFMTGYGGTEELALTPFSAHMTKPVHMLDVVGRLLGLMLKRQASEIQG
jgi:DNA-binding response OmpR family regulator